MFGKKAKRIAELESILRSERAYNEKLCAELERSKEVLDNFNERINEIPAGCRLGDYCASCEFAIKYSRYIGDRIGIRTIHICGKELCKGYKEKENA